MATWGEFISEIPIINKRSEGIFVKADHVLDLWAERNKLRDELAKVKAEGGSEGAAPPIESPTEVESIPLADPVADDRKDVAAQVRENCAQEVEEFAQSCPVDPAYREFAVQLLRTAAQLLRERPQADVADFLSQVTIPPTTEPAPPADLIADETLLMAEPVEEEQSPFQFGERGA